MFTYSILDLRLRWRSLLWWSVSVLLLSAMVAAFYRSIAGEDAYSEVFGNLPESLQGLLGGVDLGTPVGYLSTEMYSFFMPAVLLVFAIGRSSSTVAGEEEEHTLDLLLAQPIGRGRLYVEKWISVLVGVAILSVAVALPVLIIGDWAGLDIPQANLWGATAQLFVFTVFFSAVALAISAGTGRRSAGVAIAAGVAFATYLIDGFGKSIAWLEPWRVITPWYWYDISVALSDEMPWGSFAILAVASVIVAAGGLFAFQRRNLRA